MNNTINSKSGKIKFIHIISIAFILYFAYTMFDQQLQINKYNSQIEMYESDIESKNRLVEYYDSQKTNVDSDEYIEKVARDSLGYVKPYEKIFIDANK